MNTTLPTVVLIGPHGAGKTTLGTLLAARLGCEFEREIGAELRREALASDPAQHAMTSQEAFDDRVFQLELERDTRSVLGAARVVETWHSGNMAYAHQRSPEAVRRWMPRLRGHLARWRPVVMVQPLRISRATALARLSEPGPDADSLVDFFRAVGEQAEQIARGWRLRVLPTLDTDAETPESLVTRVVASMVIGVGARRGLPIPAASQRTAARRGV